MTHLVQALAEQLNMQVIDLAEPGKRTVLFSTHITFIRIDEDGRKAALPQERVENSPVL